MSSLDGRRVLRTELKESLFVEGIGQIDSAKLTESITSPLLSAVIDGNFVNVVFKGQGNQRIEVAVPMTNVKGLRLAPMEVKPLPVPMLKE